MRQENVESLVFNNLRISFGVSDRKKGSVKNRSFLCARIFQRSKHPQSCLALKKNDQTLEESGRSNADNIYCLVMSSRGKMFSLCSTLTNA